MDVLGSSEDGVYVEQGKERPDCRELRVTVSPEWPVPPEAPRYLLTPAQLMGHPLDQSAARPTPSPDAGGRKGEGADTMALSHFLCKAQ